MIYDHGAKGLQGTTLRTYASKFRNCDKGLDTGYIKFGDEAALAAFDERIRKDHDAVLSEMRGFIDETIDAEANGKWLVRAVLEMIESDESIGDDTEFYILPGNVPVCRSCLGELGSVELDRFLLGICLKCRTLHLRHTFATRCIESGIPPVVLKAWLGHKDIHTTIDTYTDVFKSMDIKAVDQFDEYINVM